MGGAVLNCDDNNVCTTDGCGPTSGCTHAYNSQACDDENACTTNDRCSGGTCAGTLHLCLPGPCEEGAWCDGNGGCTYTRKEPGAGCDDGDPCTIDDECDGQGLCVGTPEPMCTPDGAEDGAVEAAPDAGDVGSADVAPEATSHDVPDDAHRGGSGSGCSAHAFSGVPNAWQALLALALAFVAGARRKRWISRARGMR